MMAGTTTGCPGFIRMEPPVENHNAREPESLTDNEVRGGIKLGVMRYVLLWGIAIAALLLLLGYFFT